MGADTSSTNFTPARSALRGRQSVRAPLARLCVLACKLQGSFAAAAVVSAPRTNATNENIQSHLKTFISSFHPAVEQQPSFLQFLQRVFRGGNSLFKAYYTEKNCTDLCLGRDVTGSRSHTPTVRERAFTRTQRDFGVF